MNDSDGRRFESAGKALGELQTAFNDWGSILTTHSLQAAYAVIAANWAVHGATKKILDNCWSKWSLTIVLVFLGINLLATRCMVRLHYKQHLYAGENPNQWQREYEQSKGKRYWPYTKCIEYLGVALRELKAWGPVIGAFLFVLSLFFGSYGS